MNSLYLAFRYKSYNQRKTMFLVICVTLILFLKILKEDD